MTATQRRILSGTAEELAPLEASVVRLRIEHVLPESAYPVIGELLADRADVELWVERGEDLEVLRWCSGLRALNVNALRLTRLDGIELVADSLTQLTISSPMRRLSIGPVAELHALRRLAVNGTWKDIETLGRLTGLERLAVGSIDLEWLRPLTELRRFECGLGSIGSLEVLPEIGRLESVALWRLRGEPDLAPLGRITTLRYLDLATTSSITSVPSFADCPDLRWVALEAMRGLTDLRPIAEAPNLAVLLLVDMRHLDADALRPFVGHPTLRAGIWGFGSARRNRAAVELLPLPPANGQGVPWDRPDWDGPPHPSRI